MRDDVVLESEGLTKAYNGFVAVDGLDLTVARGEVFGLLGPNGAGKTTTILMLLGLTGSRSGNLRTRGDARAHRGPVWGPWSPGRWPIT